MHISEINRSIFVIVRSILVRYPFALHHGLQLALEFGNKSKMKCGYLYPETNIKF